MASGILASNSAAPFRASSAYTMQRKQDSSPTETFAIQHHEIITALQRSYCSLVKSALAHLLFASNSLYLTGKTRAQLFVLQKRSQSHIPPTIPLRPAALPPPHSISSVKETSPASIGKMEGMDLAIGKRKRSISNSLPHQQRPHPQTPASKSKSIHHSHVITFTLVP